MKILPLHLEIEDYLKKHNLKEKFEKQKLFFELDFRYPSLHTELLEPKEMRIYSFKIDRKYRAIFIFHSNNAVEIIDVNNHYQ
jgi:plasmid maintenance system killer protein